MNLFDITVDTGELEDQAMALGEQCERLLSAGCVNGVRVAVEAGASYARANHAWQNRTGALTASIDSRMDVVTANGAIGTIEATAKHASYMERGTPPHRIEPRSADGVLVFQVNGRTVFAKSVAHPGTQAMPFIGPAGDAAALVLADEIDAALSAVAALIEG